MTASGESSSLQLRLPAAGLPARLPAVRTELTDWTAALGLPSRVVEDIVLATHEALANVADHAYPPTGQDAAGETDAAHEAVLEAYRTPEVIVVVVRDRGRWRAADPDPGWRGRGLQIMRGLAAELRVQRAADGTTVEMRWPLPDPLWP